MIYGTGGFAFGDQSLRVLDTVTGVSVGRSDFALGWTAGGGIEWAFAPGWSLKAEALYFDIEPIASLRLARYLVHSLILWALTLAIPA